MSVLKMIGWGKTAIMTVPVLTLCLDPPLTAAGGWRLHGMQWWQQWRPEPTPPLCAPPPSQPFLGTSDSFQASLRMNVISSNNTKYLIQVIIPNQTFNLIIIILKIRKQVKFKEKKFFWMLILGWKSLWLSPLLIYPHLPFDRLSLSQWRISNHTEAFHHEETSEAISPPLSQSSPLTKRGRHFKKWTHLVACEYQYIKLPPEQSQFLFHLCPPSCHWH